MPLVKRKQKKFKSLQKTSKANMLVEARHVGLETSDWSIIPSEKLESKIYENLRHYGYFYDHKDSFKWAIEWIRIHRPNDEKKFSEGRIPTATLGNMCKIHMNGAPFSNNQINWINSKIDDHLKNLDKEIIDETEVVNFPTTATITRRKLNRISSSIEDLVDDHGINVTPKYHEEFMKKLNVYEMLMTENPNKHILNNIHKKFNELFIEFKQLCEGNDIDLTEGYKHITKTNQKRILEIYKKVVEDIERFMNNLEANKPQIVKKAIRKKKEIPIEKRIANFRYMKDHKDLQLTSHDPKNIVGSKEVYLYNTRVRKLHRIVAKDNETLDIKGLRIINYDEEISKMKNVRKPYEILQKFMKVTAKKAETEFMNINSKEINTNAKSHNDIIILKVFQ